MTTFLLIRHGQSTANVTMTFAGHSHVPLSGFGWEQARRAGDYLAKNYAVDRIYSSDLLRAVMTACAVSEKLGMMPIYTDPGLREIDAGDWEGKTFEALGKQYPEEIEIWYHTLWRCSCPGGESVEEMGARVMDTLFRIAAENDGKTVAVTTHATPIRAVLSYAQRGDFKGMLAPEKLFNASVTVADCDPDKHTLFLKTFGFSEHLGDLTAPAP